MIQSLNLPKDYISPSQLNAYIDCPFKYYLRYVQGLKIPPGSNLTFGSAYDDAMNAHYSQKIKDGVGLTVKQTMEVFASGVDKRKDETVWDVGSEDDDKDSADKQKDDGVKLIDEYFKVLEPTVYPATVQDSRTIQIGAGFNLAFKVVTDLKTKDGVIVDNKTARRKEKEINDRYFLQVVSYAAVDTAATSVRLDYAVRKKVPEVYSLSLNPTSKDFQLLRTQTAQVLNGISHRVYPVNRRSMLCSRRLCGFWEICERERGGKVKP